MKPTTERFSDTQKRILGIVRQWPTLHGRKLLVRALQRAEALPQPERDGWSLPRAERLDLVRAQRREMRYRLMTGDGEPGVLTEKGVHMLSSGQFIPAMAGGARNRDLAMLPPLTAQPNTNITATETDYYLNPTGRRFVAVYLLHGVEADADFTTGDEDIAPTIDYTLDGAAWTAVAALADLGTPPVDGDQYLQYEPVTYPATIASQKITAHAASEIDVEIPEEAVTRVVNTIAGTTPDFQNLACYVLGHFH